MKLLLSCFNVFFGALNSSFNWFHYTGASADMLARPWYFGGFCRFRLFLSHWCLFKSSFLSSLWFKLLMWCCKNDWQQSPACDWAIRCTNENWRLTQVCQVGQTLHPGYFGFILVHLVDATSIFIFVIMTTFRLHIHTQHLFLQTHLTPVKFHKVCRCEDNIQISAVTSLCPHMPCSVLFLTVCVLGAWVCVFSCEGASACLGSCFLGVHVHCVVKQHPDHAGGGGNLPC